MKSDSKEVDGEDCMSGTDSNLFFSSKDVEFRMTSLKES